MTHGRAVDVDQALNLEEGYLVVLALAAMVEEKYCASKRRAVEPSQIETIPALILIFDGEICNGGFDQFFTNSSGDSALETLQALKTVRAVKTTALLEEAFSVFEGALPPPTVEERWEQVYADGAKERIHETFLRLDDQYYNLDESVYDLATKHLREHRLALIRSYCST